MLLLSLVPRRRRHWRAKCILRTRVFSYDKCSPFDALCIRLHVTHCKNNKYFKCYYIHPYICCPLHLYGRCIWLLVVLCACVQHDSFDLPLLECTTDTHFIGIDLHAACCCNRNNFYAFSEAHGLSVHFWILTIFIAFRVEMCLL